ncbi:MAG TPA: hypothetical protein VF897_15125 [Roseiflexaceae bacterium]
MKPFKSVAVVKYPLELVWPTIRDRLPELVPFLDDIESITVLERAEDADGVVRLVNLWKANPRLPAPLASAIPPAALTWIDRAEWRPRSHECHWRIELQCLPERAQYAGLTSYVAAIGGRGTRITFEGQLDVPERGLAASSPLIEGALAKGVESVVTTMIPQNFLKLTQALSTFLGAEA